jgi:DNA-binding IclR family transcriptional regulator
MDNRYIIRPVLRSFAVLEAVAASPHPLSLKQVVADTGLPKTTTFKHLQTLRKAGYLAQEPGSERIGLGVKFLMLSGTNSRYQQLADICRPAMETLREGLGETVNLATLEGSEIVYVAVLESRRFLRTAARMGGRDPAYTTGVGKAMLATLPTKERERAVPTAALTPVGARPISRTEIMASLAEVKERGYALDNGESETDVRCVGCVIPLPQMLPIAGLSVSGPLSRLTDDLILPTVERLKQAVADIVRRVETEVSLVSL